MQVVERTTESGRARPPAAARTTGVRRHGPALGPVTVCGLRSLQGLAGNRAVTQVLQRQKAPEIPAPSTAPTTPTTATTATTPTTATAPTTASPAGDDHAPVRLPPAGGMSFTLSSGRRIDLGIGDLRDFGLGQGVVQTIEIPAGDLWFISLKGSIGSHDPLTLTTSSLTLDPVIASISATEVARGLPENSEKAQIAKAAAAAGGIGGGLQGLLYGALLGGRLGPVAGVYGAARGARFGAEQGGLAAGQAAEWLYDRVTDHVGFGFSRDVELIARLDQGQIHGDVGLTYTPFVRLALGLTNAHWVANIAAELQTALDLAARVTLSLAGSHVRLRFRDGELVRSEFTLASAIGLGVQLDAQARLRLTGSFLNILESTQGDDALISGELVTDPFRLFTIGGHIGAQTDFTFSKGSPLDVLRRKITAAPNATRDLFIAGIRKSGRNVPLLKDRAALDAKSRTGLTPDDAIVMAWHKPAQWYPDYLTRPLGGSRRQLIPKFPNRDYDTGFSAGVDFWPHEGMVLRYRGGEEPRGRGVARFIQELREEGIELDYDLAYKADIDHVVDWAFGGLDDETNLWPLESGANRSAGVTQNRLQEVWWAEQPGGQPRRTRIENVPTGRYFRIGQIRPAR